MIVLLARPASAAADSAAIAISANPTAGVPMTITASGSAAAGEDLWLFVQPASTACATNVYNEVYFTSNTEAALVSGEALAAGTYSDQVSYTPTQSASYNLCAYVSPPGSDSTYTAPTATSSAAFTAQPQSGTVAIAISSAPTAELPITITTTGSTEAGDDLWVFVQPASTACATSVYNEVSFTSNTETATTSGRVLGPGSFTDSGNYTPPSAGSYNACAYVSVAGSDTSYQAPEAVASTIIQAVAPSGTISTSFGNGQITLQGTSEAARQLWVYANPPTEGCLYSAYQESFLLNYRAAPVSVLVSGAAVGPGAFTEATALADAGSVQTCAYLQKSGAATTTVSDFHNVCVNGATVTEDPPPPVASFTLPTTFPAFVSQTFVGTTSSGCDLSYNWSFGVGEPSSADADPAFAPDGFFEFPVSLTVTDPFARSSTVEHSIGSTDEPLAPRDGTTITDLAPGFRWRGSSEWSDKVRLWNHSPVAGAKPLATRDQGADEVSYDSRAGVKTTSFGLLPPGTYYWDVVLSANVGPTWSFVIKPPPLRHLQVHTSNHLGPLSTSPGATSVDIRAAPYAKVTLAVSYAGRRYRRVTFTPSVRADHSFRFAWSCVQPGIFHYAVFAADRYGHRRHASGKWDVSAARCATLAAQEAARRAALLAAIHHRDATCMQEGGTNATIGGEYQCLRSNTACDPSLESEYAAYGYQCNIVGGVVVIVVVADNARLNLGDRDFRVDASADRLPRQPGPRQWSPRKG